MPSGVSSVLDPIVVPPREQRMRVGDTEVVIFAEKLRGAPMYLYQVYVLPHTDGTEAPLLELVSVPNAYDVRWALMQRNRK